MSYLGKALFATLDCISFSLTALQFCSTLNHRRFLDRQSLGARTAPAKKKNVFPTTFYIGFMPFVQYQLTEGQTVLGVEAFLSLQRIQLLSGFYFCLFSGSSLYYLFSSSLLFAVCLFLFRKLTTHARNSMRIFQQVACFDVGSSRTASLPV